MLMLLQICVSMNFSLRRILVIWQRMNLFTTGKYRQTNSKEAVMIQKTLAGVCLLLFLGFAVESAHALCVKVPKANVRSGPGTGYEIIWEVYKYMPFRKMGVSLSGEWYAVGDVDGDVNWIHRSLLTGSYDCAVVKTAQVNIRSGPGTNYPKASFSPAKQYHTFKVLKKKGKWYKLRDEWGDTGWIHKNFLWIN